MKLLIIFPSKIRSGAEEYALTIAQAAVKKGWQVDAAFPQTQENESLIKDFKNRGISYHPLDISPVDGKNFKLFREHIPHFYRSFSLLKKLKPNVIHLNIPWPYWCFDTLLSCGFLNIPTVVTFHLFPGKFSYSKLRLTAYQWLHGRNQKWIAISKNNRNFIAESFQIPKEKLPVIYNGVKIESEFINYSPKQIINLRQKVRKEIGVNPDDILLLTVGRLESQKGYQDLVEIISPIIKEFPKAKFIWVGEGKKRDYLVQKINKYNLNNNVILLGYRKDVPRLLKSSDLFIFPTYFEGLPFALIEAIAYNLPIVASKASSNPEIIEQKVDGLLFPKGDKEELKEAVLWGLRNPEAMKKMAINAAEKVKNFSEEKMTNQTLEIIENMTHEKN